MHYYPKPNNLGEKNGSYTHPERVPRGENHFKAKLNEEKVRELREKYKAGGRTRALAREYGIAHSTCTNAINGKTWKHVGEDRQGQR